MLELLLATRLSNVLAPDVFPSEAIDADPALSTDGIHLETSNTEHEEKEEGVLQIVNASAAAVAHNTLE